MAVLDRPTFGVTPREAAGLLGVSLVRVNKAIEQGVIETTSKGAGERILDEAALAGLALIGDADLGLSVRVKRRITAWVRKEHPERSPALELPLEGGLVVRYPEEIAARVAQARRYLARRGEWITSDPQIRGGTPVITGTRIGVHGLADRVADGDTIESLLEDYPTVPLEALETAVEFARLNPRRGRPVRKPWQAPA